MQYYQLTEVLKMVKNVSGILALALTFLALQANGSLTDKIFPPSQGSGLIEFKQRAKPTLGTAPLDPSAEIDSLLSTLTQVLNMVDGGVSSLVAGLTGISLTNCATQIKRRGDLKSLTCAEFIDAVSNCESLMYVKDLLQVAKKGNKKNPNSKKPCFK